MVQGTHSLCFFIQTISKKFTIMHRGIALFNVCYVFKTLSIFTAVIFDTMPDDVNIHSKYFNFLMQFCHYGFIGNQGH